MEFQLQTETVIDILPTKKDSQPSQIPGEPDLLPRLLESWNSQPETSSAEEPPENPLAAPPSESLKEPPNSQPDTQETHVDTTTKVS